MRNLSSVPLGPPYLHHKGPIPIARDTNWDSQQFDLTDQIAFRVPRIARRSSWEVCTPFRRANSASLRMARPSTRDTVARVDGFTIARVDGFTIVRVGGFTM
eukprot:247760-Prorocentrum_minimum.AAC.1